MALARLNRKVEPTTGKGNCAFNAFALGLCDAEVLDHIEDYFISSREEIKIALAEFIKDMANTLEIPAKWPALKNALLNERKASTRELQAKVAPILRDLSITILSRYEDALYQLHVYNDILRDEFSDFVDSHGDVSGENSEKLFARYPFIFEKFTEVIRDPKLSKDPRIEQEEYLINWWWGWGLDEDQQSGCKLFQEAIQSSDKKGPPHSDRNLMQVAHLLTASTIHHRQHMTMNLLSAYDFYKNGLSGNGDDVFTRHQFIKEKFAVIKQKGMAEEQEQRELRGWWWHSGYRAFLRKMRKNGSWAGDLELTILAEYFRIAFFVVSKSDEKNINKHAGNYGYFPHLSADKCEDIPEHDWLLVKNTLIERMVIDRNREHKDGHDYLITSLDELEARLRTVAGLEDFDDYASRNSDTLKNTVVPEGWAEEYMTYFIKNRMIAHRPNNAGYQFDIDGLSLRETHGNWLKSVENKSDFRFIKEFIDRHTDKVKLQPVPKEYLQTPEMIEQLIKRNVIERCFGTKDQYKFSVDANTAKRRVAAIPHLNAVLAIGRKHFQELAEIILYKTDDHWSNTYENIPAEEKQARVVAREQERASKRTFPAHHPFAGFSPNFFAGSTASVVMRMFCDNSDSQAFKNRFT